MRLPVLFLLLTVMVDSMGIGLILPVLPDLITEVSGQDLSRAALWGGVLSTVYAFMQFLCAPLLGALSDTYGRRPVLLITLAIMVVDYVVLAVAGTLWLLVLARLVGGIAAATQSAASAAMADLSSPGERAQGFGLIGAAFGIGFVLGPTLGGLLGEFGSRAPFWAAGALATLNLLIGLAFFPETVTPENRRRFDIRAANPLGAFRALARLPGLQRSLAILFLYHLAFAVYPSVWAFFTQARFGWSAGMTGLSLGLFGISMAVVQGWLIRPVLARLGERGTAVYGLVFSALGLAAIGLVTSGTLALCLVPLTALGAVFAPALQALMSQRVGPDRQGLLQGVLGSTAAVAMVIAPMIMTTVFSVFTAPGRTTPFPGAPFILSLGLVLLALALFVSRRRGYFAG